MLTDPNPPNRTAEPRALTRSASAGAHAIPPITLDAGTFRRFVTAAWSQPRIASRTRTEGRSASAPAPDALVALRLKSFT